MQKFVRNLITEWRKLELPFADEKILVAVSGGADSVSLVLALHKLYELKKLRLEFIVVHFNHNLRGAQSDEDEKYVKKLAQKLNFQFFTDKPNIKLQDQKGNLEQFARNARYDFLAEAALKLQSPLILTAHTLNDQAETFLLNLLRGSGLEGLSAMKAKRLLRLDESLKSSEKNAISLVRPFLSWAKREDTESFCRENKVEFRQDAMNEDRKFSRVRIRKELIPFLQTFNPKIIETLSKTSRLLKNETELLTEESFEKEDVLSVINLKLISKPQRLRCLRSWIRKHRGDLRRIEADHLEAVDNLIVSRKSGRLAELPGGDRIIKSGGKLSFEVNKVEKRRLAN